MKIADLPLCQPLTALTSVDDGIQFRKFPIEKNTVFSKLLRARGSELLRAPQVPGTTISDLTSYTDSMIAES